jgi:hypothetical protein
MPKRSDQETSVQLFEIDTNIQIRYPVGRVLLDHLLRIYCSTSAKFVLESHPTDQASNDPRPNALLVFKEDPGAALLGYIGRDPFCPGAFGSVAHDVSG